MARQAFLAADKIKLTAKQSNIYQWGWQPEARHRVACCGRRFGKTFLAAKEMKRAAQLAAKWGIHPDNEIWYGAPTFKQAKRVFWQRLKRAIPRHWMASKPNESECYIQLVTGHILRIVGLDNYDALRGSGLFFFLGDEWADAQPECWSEVIRPMLATCQGHSLRIGTPKGFDDLYEIFQKGQPGAKDSAGFPIADHKSFSYTSAQGGNIPLHEIEAARRDLDPRTYRQEYEACFETYAGQVIYAFVRALSVKDCEYDPKLPIDIGMDFNVNPMSATVWQTVDGIDYQIDEIVIPTSNTDDMADEIVRRYAKPDGTVSHITICPDPAGAQARTSAQGQTDISILRKRGFKVLAMSSHPLVRDRNICTNSRFCNADNERRAFVSPKCKKSIEAYEKFTYREGTSEPDKEGGFDHLPDATGYRFFVRYGKTTAKKIKINGF